jgi:hypothetical protein
MCLLPYLRCLSLGSACTEAELLFLLSPQLSHFDLWISGNAPVPFAALDTLCKTCRSLTALNLSCTISQETFIKLCEIPNLQYFLLSNSNLEDPPQPLIIRNNFFHSLAASSETLYHLAFYNSLLFLLEDSSPPLEQLTFPKLKRFEISLTTSSPDFSPLQNFRSWKFWTLDSLLVPTSRYHCLGKRSGNRFELPRRRICVR